MTTQTDQNMLNDVGGTTIDVRFSNLEKSLERIESKVDKTDTKIDRLYIIFIGGLITLIATGYFQ